MSLPSYEPMLATAYPKEFDDDDWWFDVKWDGFRCIAYVGPAGAHLRSRNGKDLGGRYPELTSLELRSTSRD